MIINIRGTSGAGKTTLLRYFMDEMCDSIEEIIPEGKRKAEAIKCIYNGQVVYVLGSYKNLCGGCDTINSQDEVHRVLDDYAFEGHVIFEGLFISHIYGRYAEKAKADPDNWLFIMLETPFDTCMDHIRERRVKQGKSTEFKDTVIKNARRTYDTTYRIRKKLTADGLMWEELPLEDRFNKFELLIDNYLGEDRADI